jgi:hypothetical protein
LAFLADTDELDSEFYIVNEDDGHWNDGCWWSNYSYERWVPTDRYKYVKTGYGTWQATPKDDTDDDVEYQEWLRLNANSLATHQELCDEYWAEVDAKGVPAELTDPYYSADGTRQAHHDKVNGRYIEGSLQIDDSELVEMRCWHCDTACTIDVGPYSDPDDDFCVNCASCIFCGDDHFQCRCDHHAHRASSIHEPRSLEEALDPFDDEAEEPMDMAELIKRAAIALGGESTTTRKYQRALWDQE